MKKPVIFGLIAGIFLLGLYFLILILANSFSHAIEQFKQIWPWVLVLTFGFGLQAGLYFYVKKAVNQEKSKNPGMAMAASGGVSTGSMVACCLHHFADVLPLIGLAGLSLFLVQYQIFFLSLGVFSNLIGIAIMLEIIQKNNLSEGLLKNILIFNMGKIKKIIIVASLILLMIILIFVSGLWKKINTVSSQNAPTSNQNGNSSEIVKLTAETNSQAGVDFEVIPLDFTFGKPANFQIKIGTHSGELNFDLTKDSILKDDRGNQYLPLEWQGPAIEGHHGFGILVFPALKAGAGKIILTIQDSSGNSARIFEWDIK